MTSRDATAQTDSGTAPLSWKCLQCGTLKYLGLAHSCVTAPIPTQSPYDLNGLKEYPGE